MPHERLTQLLHGYWDVSAVASLPGVDIPEAAIPALQKLFPREDSYCYWPDRY